MKKLAYISVLLSMVFIFTTVAIAADQENSGLTLEAAQKQAVENSRQSVIDDLDIKAKETGLKNAQDDVARLGDAYGVDNVLSNRIIREVRTMEAAANLEVAKRAKQDNIAKLKLDVYTTVEDILLAGREVENEALKLEIATERLDIAKTQFSAKTITQDDLSAAEYDLDSKKLDVEALQESLKTLDMQLKRQLNLPFDGDLLKVDAKLAMDSFSEVDLDKLISERLAADTGIYASNESYKAAEKTMELTAKLYKEGDSTYDDNKVNLENAKLNYEDAKINIEVNIRNTYNDLLNLKDRQELAARYADLMKEKLDKADIWYKKGLMSKSGYLSAKESWMDAVYQNYRAIRDFNVKNAEWLN